MIESATALAELWLATGRVDDALRVTDDSAEITIRKEIWVLAAEAGLSVLSEVLDALDALGARYRAGEVLRTLRAHGRGGRAPRRGGRPSYGDRLSPRELDVVRLLVEGRTNRQIAEALVLATQTVASHLHSAMRKLRVDSRTQLALRAVELGLTSGDGDRPAGDG